MKTLGIICEYNPFHLGHKYHIEKAKELTGADTVVAVMSGNFVQRGDIAIFDKELRAKAALLNGADLIIELPTLMALSGAERFCRSGVEILNALKFIDYMAFGAENDNIKTLYDIAKLLSCESLRFKETLLEYLRIGLPYAAAREKAVSDFIPDTKDSLSTPNNILAIEYLKALIKTNSNITPVAIRRLGNGYNSASTHNGFISATGAREFLKDNKSLKGFVPENALSLYETSKIHSIENMSQAIIANLCKMTAEEIAQIPDVSEGLENKIKKEAMISNSFYELCDNIKSKRYAHSRIRRILLHSYLGIKKEDLILPQYIKILDFNEKGRELLNKIKQETKLPLVKNFNQIKAMNNAIAEEMWKKELTFDRIYNLF